MANSAFPTPTNISAATQSEQEIASSTSVYVSPGRQKYHPGHPKAWVSFNGTGTVSIYASYNVTSITDNGTGDYTVNFTVAFSSINYCATMSFSRDTNANTGNINTNNLTGAAVTPTASATRIAINQFNVGPVDPTYISVTAFGDQ